MLGVMALELILKHIGQKNPQYIKKIGNLAVSTDTRSSYEGPRHRNFWGPFDITPEAIGT
jgi:hypothetical protein